MKIIINIQKIIFFYCILIMPFNNLFAENSKFEIQSKIVNYKKNNSLIIADGEASAKDANGREIFSDRITYDKLDSIIYTNNNSVFIDKKNNKILAKKFIYNINLKKIEAIGNVEYYSQSGDQFSFDHFVYFENSEKGFGKKAIGLLSDGSSIEGNEAEIDNLKGVAIINSSQEKSFFKNFLNLFNSEENNYTPCKIITENKKKTKENCPDWSLTTKKTIHDSNKKIITHNHAFIKIRNFPVFYSPYFSHPDPTVKRKSGFLSPSSKSFNNLGRSIKTPYFYEINENKDLTFTPIIYQDEYPIFLGEYREQFASGKIYIDSSYSKGYKNLNKIGDDGVKIERTGGSRNHLFVNYISSFKDVFYYENDLEINVQRISQKNYLKVNQINTEHVLQDTTSLNNNIIFNSYDKNKKLQISAFIYDDITNDDDNTKYQYTLPYIEHNNYFNKFNSYININNTLEFKNLGGDSNKLNQINRISLDTEQKILNTVGVGNIFKFYLNNINTYNQNISSEKENLNNDMIGTFALESFYPLVKYNEDNEQAITPKMFLKYTTGSMRKIDSGNILTYNDIFSIDRVNNSSNPERGANFGYGVEYLFDKLNDDKKKYLNTKLTFGQVLKDKEYEEIPVITSLNKKTSNFVGSVNFNYNQMIKNNISTKELNEKFDQNPKQDGFAVVYDYNLSNNLNKILKNEISFDYNNRKNSFRTTYSELHDISNGQTISADYRKYFDSKINFGLGIVKDLENKYTQSNHIDLNYESDCLKIGINLAKQFYNNQDIKPANNLNLYIVLKPFGQPFAPNLTNLINEN